MKVSDIIERRRPEWRELETDIEWAKTLRGRGLNPERVTAFVRRYRAVCGDLSLAISMRFPAGTIQYLHQLVARAHTQIYRSETFQLRNWATTLMVEVPRRILRDPCTWISFAVFWGLFFGAILATWMRPEFAQQVVGEAQLDQMEMMYAKPMEDENFTDTRTAMTGFYLFNNAGIGLRCFASGIFLGVGSLVVLAFNAIMLGTVFGHMLMSVSSDNFVTFVTAHGPFELTAVVLSGGAGLRLGWSLIDTGGWNRMESLRRTAPRALEIAGAATVLFLFAAFIEGYISPSSLPYEYKLSVAFFSTLLLVGYIFGLSEITFRQPPESASS